MLPVINSAAELIRIVGEIGFIPFFKSSVKGFSVEEITTHLDWWGENRELDPWEWRKAAATDGSLAYCKIFGKKAGFVSRAYFPVFAAFRRGNLTFVERYENGLSSMAEKRIMALLSDGGSLPSHMLKKQAGFSKDGEKNFEGAITNLQMQTYAVIRGFECKRNSFGHEYGWASAVYSTAEALFGEQHVDSAHALSAQEAEHMIFTKVASLFPDASEKQINKLIR